MAVTPDLAVTNVVTGLSGTYSPSFNIPISGGTRTGTDVIGMVAIWYEELLGLTIGFPAPPFPRPSATVTWGSGLSCTLVDESYNVVLYQSLPFFPALYYYRTNGVMIFSCRAPALSGNISVTMNAGGWDGFNGSISGAGVTFLDAAIPSELVGSQGTSGTSSSVTVITVPTGSSIFAAHGVDGTHSAYNRTTLTNQTQMRTGWASGSGSNITSTLTQTSNEWASAGVQINPYDPSPFRTKTAIRTSGSWNTRPGTRIWNGTQWVPAKSKRYHSGGWH